MILYSKFGEFIGIGREELTMLGFDDMDDFTSYHKDFADLFVNRPGYIFKFKNFSWIDYALHSGAPRKSAIIKQKNGNDIEINLRIKELYLVNPNEEHDLYYYVEISNQGFTDMPSAMVTNQATPTEPIATNGISQSSFEENSENVRQEEIKNSEMINSNEELNILQDYTPQEKEESTFVEDIYGQEEIKVSEEQEPAGIKLKVDKDVFAALKEEPEQTQQESFIEEYQAEDPIDLNFDEPAPLKEESTEISEEPFTKEAEESISLNFDEPTPLKEELPTEPEIKQEEPEEVTLEFDLGDCAQELDLDIGDIAEIITEYIEKIERSIPKLYEYIQNNQTKKLRNSIYKLKGIADSLHVNDFSNQLNKILAEQDKVKQKNQLQVFETLFSQFKEKLV